MKCSSRHSAKIQAAIVPFFQPPSCHYSSHHCVNVWAAIVPSFELTLCHCLSCHCTIVWTAIVPLFQPPSCHYLNCHFATFPNHGKVKHHLPTYLHTMNLAYIHAGTCNKSTRRRWPNTSAGHHGLLRQSITNTLTTKHLKTPVTSLFHTCFHCNIKRSSNSLSFTDKLTIRNFTPYVTYLTRAHFAMLAQML